MIMSTVAEATAAVQWYTAHNHQHAPEHQCKHLLARGLYLRAAAVLRRGDLAEAVLIKVQEDLRHLFPHSEV
jgi:hypothetical protein